eukprot:Colp12_sorted_trinity150504_noHs@32391
MKSLSTKGESYKDLYENLPEDVLRHILLSHICHILRKRTSSQSAVDFASVLCKRGAHELALSFAVLLLGNTLCMPEHIKQLLQDFKDADILAELLLRLASVGTQGHAHFFCVQQILLDDHDEGDAAVPPIYEPLMCRFMKLLVCEVAGGRRLQLAEQLIDRFGPAKLQKNVRKALVELKQAVVEHRSGLKIATCVPLPRASTVCPLSLL